MRTITKTINLYNYSELCDKAKARVREDYLSDLREMDFFYEDMLYRLKNDFPSSDLSVQYSLSYCQGDGFNIYGKFSLVDILPHMDDLTEKERRTIMLYAEKIFFEIEFSYNERYYYSLKRIDKNDRCLIEDIINDAENACLRDFNVELVRRVAGFACDYFYELDKKYERSGYKYFYEVDDETVTYWAEANGYEFTEDGEIYTEA